MAYLNKRENEIFRRELRRNSTEVERILWASLRGHRMLGFKFFRQFGVGRFILDFYCPEKKLAIELDGSQHGTSDGRAYDAERTAYLNGCGIQVARYWNNDVLNKIDSVLESIAMELTKPIRPSS